MTAYHVIMWQTVRIRKNIRQKFAIWRKMIYNSRVSIAVLLQMYAIYQNGRGLAAINACMGR